MGSSKSSARVTACPSPAADVQVAAIPGLDLSPDLARDRAQTRFGKQRPSDRRIRAASGTSNRSRLHGEVHLRGFEGSSIDRCKSGSREEAFWLRIFARLKTASVLIDRLSSDSRIVKEGVIVHRQEFVLLGDVRPQPNPSCSHNGGSMRFVNRTINVRQKTSYRVREADTIRHRAFSRASPWSAG